MAGRLYHRELELANPDYVAFLDVPVRPWRGLGAHAEECRLGGGVLEQRGVLLVYNHLGMGLLLERQPGLDMVEVRVGEYDVLELKPFLVQGGHDARRLAPRVDDGRLTRHLRAHYVAVHRKRAYNQSL